MSAAKAGSDPGLSFDLQPGPDAGPCERQHKQQNPGDPEYVLDAFNPISNPMAIQRPTNYQALTEPWQSLEFL
jgi:hypothetical protein